MTDATLFDPGPPLPDPLDGLSAGQRLTLRNHQLLAEGTHPATHTATRPDLGRCGDCAHAIIEHHGGSARAWWKCELHRLGRSHSAASDIRVGWPACARFEPR